MHYNRHDIGKGRVFLAHSMMLVVHCFYPNEELAFVDVSNI
jgi:hypothetical protein